MSPRLSRRTSRRAAVVAGAAALTLAVSGYALAAVPDATTKTISACYAKTGGALRVIDPSAGQKCKATEKPLSWRSGGVTFRGAWTAATAYQPGDAVSYNGSSYVAIANSQAAQPETGSSVWGVLAQAGAAGSPGATGPAGPAGPVGPAGPAGPSQPTNVYTKNVVTGPFIATDGSETEVARLNLEFAKYLATAKVWLSNYSTTDEARIWCNIGVDSEFVNLAPGQNEVITLIGPLGWTSEYAKNVVLLCHTDRPGKGNVRTNSVQLVAQQVTNISAQ